MRQRVAIYEAFVAYFEALREWNNDPGSHRKLDELRRAIARVHEASRPARSWGPQDVVVDVTKGAPLR